MVANEWIDLKRHKPSWNIRVLVCDENGYVCIENTMSPKEWIQMGFKENEKWDFEKSWENGNGTKLVAWMPLPDFPENLCNDDADGEIP